MVEAAIAAEEECKSVCISTPHLMITTHMSTAGSNALSASMRFAVLTVGCPPPKLLEPTRPMVPLPRNHRHRPRKGRVLRPATLEEALLRYYHSNDSYGVPRSSTGAWPGGVGSSAAALLKPPSQVPRIHATARRIRAASRRSSGQPVETPHRESPPGRQSQPRGVRAHGAPLEVRNRCGAGTRTDCRPFRPGSPEHQPSVQIEDTPCGESPDGTTPRYRGYRVEKPNGHTAATPNTREPTGFYAPIPSGLRAFGISLRASVPCGSIWWSGCVAWRGRRPAADTDGEPWCTCWFCGPSGGRTGTT